MTKILFATIIPALVFALVITMISADAASPKGLDVCEVIDENNCRLVFSWLPSDASSDPNNLVVVSGSFTRIGLVSDTTTNVQASLEGMMVGAAKSISTETVTSMAGTTTISTTVDAKSRGVNNLMGTVQIDGEVYTATFKAAGLDATLLQVEETFTGPGVSQSLNQERVTVPATVKMCNDDESKCFHGFGTIKRESSQTTVGTSSITFTTDVLEAEVINEEGLFKLTLSKLQRTVVTVP